VAVGNQDGGGVPMSAAVLLGSLNEALDLPLGQIFAAAPANCYILLRLVPRREVVRFPWK
jgi:hypothetical protein